MSPDKNTTNANVIQTRPSADLFTIAFGVVVAMWTGGYFSRMPPAMVPGWALLALFAMIQVAGGVILGARTDRTWRAVPGVGFGTALINTLVLGSILGEGHTVGEAFVGVAGLVVVSIVLCAFGFALGRPKRPVTLPEVNWTGRLAKVAFVATLVLIVAGGLVTGWEAGLAVADWPNSEGVLMFLYPLSKMTGGVYYEHAHRLYGTLVGLTTIALAVQLWIARRGGASNEGSGPPKAFPYWLRMLGVCAVVLVTVQGVLGGLRVTGRFTTEQHPESLQPITELAIVHGITAQVFLGLITAIVVFVSTSWRRGPAAVSRPTAGFDRSLAMTALVVLFIQLILGAVYRHLSADPEIGSKGVLHILYTHMSFAMIVLGVIVFAGLRATTHYGDIRPVKRAGKAMMHTVGLQLVLGVVAFVAVVMRKEGTEIPAYEVWSTTAHQAIGALLFALATIYVLMTRRFITPRAESGQTETAEDDMAAHA